MAIGPGIPRHACMHDARPGNRAAAPSIQPNPKNVTAHSADAGRFPSHASTATYGMGTDQRQDTRQALQKHGNPTLPRAAHQATRTRALTRRLRIGDRTTHLRRIPLEGTKRPDNLERLDERNETNPTTPRVDLRDSIAEMHPRERIGENGARRHPLEECGTYTARQARQPTPQDGRVTYGLAPEGGARNHSGNVDGTARGA